MNSKKLQLGQIEVKLKAFTGAASVVAPPTGWIRAVRLVLVYGFVPKDGSLEALN